MSKVDVEALLASAPNRAPREQQIIDAAAVVFHEKGYDASTIQDIADAVGILKGSLYYYIDSKEDLLFEVLRDAHHDSMRHLAHWQQVDGDVLLRLRAFIEGHVRANILNHIKAGVFFHDFRSLSPERQRAIIHDRDAYDAYARDLIRQGQADGLIAPEVDAKMAALALMGMMNWVYQWYRPDDEGGSTPEEVARAFTDFAVFGLAVRDDVSREVGWRLEDLDRMLPRNLRPAV